MVRLSMERIKREAKKLARNDPSKSYMQHLEAVSKSYGFTGWAEAREKLVS